MGRFTPHKCYKSHSYAKRDSMKQLPKNKKYAPNSNVYKSITKTHSTSKTLNRRYN